jgi:hypothetical protein
MRGNILIQLMSGVHYFTFGLKYIVASYHFILDISEYLLYGLYLQEPIPLLMLLRLLFMISN